MACLRIKGFHGKGLGFYQDIVKYRSLYCVCLNEMFFAVSTRAPALHAVVYIFLNILFDIL